MDERGYESLRRGILFRIKCREEQSKEIDKQLEIEYNALSKLDDEWLKVKYPNIGDRVDAIKRMYE